MPRYFPSELPPGTYSSEERVWRACTSLDDRWRVFHSVRWQSVRRGRQGDGEADFVLVHPGQAIVVLEVKGGRIDVTDGAWTSTDRYGQRHAIKNPFEQATDSKHSLIARLNDIEPRLQRVPDVCHGVVFPDGDVVGDIGMYGPRDIIWTSNDLLNVETALQRLLGHWSAHGALTPAELLVVTRVLAPTVKIRSGLRSKAAQAEHELLSLTQQQIEAADLMRKVRRALITGGPGTGKTVLAVDRARFLAGDGASVLLTCFNEPLTQRLADETGDEPKIRVATFHALCLSEVRKAGQTIPDRLEGWWEEASADALLRAATETGLAFDAIIIDEAQDFAQSWLTALVMLLSSGDDGFFIVFADANQALYRAGWQLPDVTDEYPLTINCRSTLEVLDRVRRVFGETVSGRGAHGPKPLFVSVKSGGESIDEAQQVAARLVEDESIRPDQIAVLCFDRATVDILRGRSIGSCSFVEPGRSGIAVETVHRFKGLEAEVVVLVLGDNELSDVASRTLAYVGMSRARTVLVVLGTKRARESLNWA